jgi:hypothetical protein
MNSIAEHFVILASSKENSLLLHSHINLHFRWLQSNSLNKVKVLVPRCICISRKCQYSQRVTQGTCQANKYSKCRGGSRQLPCQLPRKVKEGLLKVVVAFGRNFIVLQVLLPVESNLLGLNLPVLDINLVTAQDNRNALTHPAIHNWIPVSL